MIELIVYGISDDNTQEAAAMRDFSKIPDLISYLSTVSKPVYNKESTVRKRFAPSPAVNIHNYKKPRIEASDIRNKQCFKCGKIGHVQRACRNAPSTSGNTKQNSRDISCTFCHRSGHVEENCFTKQNIESRRNVNIITLGKTTVPTRIKIDDEYYMGLVDTGADVSLMSDKFQKTFASKLERQHLEIGGITTGSVLSSYRFKADVEITGQHTTLDFMVVPPKI